MEAQLWAAPCLCVFVVKVRGPFAGLSCRKIPPRIYESEHLGPPTWADKSMEKQSMETSDDSAVRAGRPRGYSRTFKAGLLTSGRFLTTCLTLAILAGSQAPVGKGKELRLL